MSIGQVFKSGNIGIGLSRVRAKLKAKFYNIEENGDMVAIYRSDNLEKHSINLVEKIVNF